MRADIKLVPPSKRSPYWYIRGTYEGYGPIYRSTKTGDRATAATVLAKLKKDIREGRLKQDVGPTFASAAVAYMNDGGERQFMEPIIREIGRLPIGAVDQEEIDRAAMAIAGERTPATRNRSVYTPISAVLRHAGLAVPIKRPRGAQGKPRTHWLRPEDAEKLLAAAWGLHPRFAALLTTLLYTGVRLSEALRMQVEEVHLESAFIDVPDTKNGEPQRVHLPGIVVQAIRRALEEPGNASWKRPEAPRSTGSLFCLTKSGALYELWNRVEKAAGVKLPDGVAFHLARHTFGAWTRGAGVRLEETQRWKSRGGAKPYDHYEITDAGRVADRFPSAGGLSAGQDTRATSVGRGKSAL